MDEDKVASGLATIKGRMPQTYAAIQRAAKEAGNQVFGVVRAGLRGEPNAFYAVENGFVVGTPFRMRREDAAHLAALILEWGQTHVMFWSLKIAGDIRVEVAAEEKAGIEAVRNVPSLGTQP